MQNIIGNKTIQFATIDSTNDEAKRQIKNGEGEGLVIVADKQTAGRGKPGAKWFSAQGLGLYFSCVIKPYKNPKDLAPLTVLAAEAMVRAISHLCSLQAAVKLPNDVLINNKKVCGILAERLSSGEVIIGIGLNLLHEKEDFPEDLKTTATSLFIESKKKINSQEALSAILKELNALYLAYLNKI